MKKYLTHLSLVAIALSACGDDKEELIEIDSLHFFHFVSKLSEFQRSSNNV